MTRNEAARILHDELWGGNGQAMPDKWLRVFEALGLLKLDEPKGPVERAVDAMFIRSHAFDGGGVITPRQAIEAIHSAGLKIVEK